MLEGQKYSKFNRSEVTNRERPKEAKESKVTGLGKLVVNSGSHW